MRGARGPHGKPIVLVESVKQDRRNHITRFVQTFVEGRGKSATRKTFSIAFRTLSVPQMVQRLENAGFDVTALLGDYQGGPWDLRAEVWIILARAKAPCAVGWRVHVSTILCCRTARRRCPACAVAQSASAPLIVTATVVSSCRVNVPRAVEPGDVLDAAGGRDLRPSRRRRPACAAPAAPRRSEVRDAVLVIDF